VTLTANPGAGEEFVNWTGSSAGDLVPDANTALVTITIDEDESVTANFDYIEYTLTINVIGSGSGTVTKSPDQATYHYGDVVQLTANPALPPPGGGSIFKGWSDDLTGSANPDSITIHAGTNAVTAEFAQTWVITATAVANGTISPSGSVQVEEGADQPFTFDPNTCYEVDNVDVDLSSIGREIREYTFSYVTEDHSIDVEFYNYDCTITATAENGGTITPSGALTVPCGSIQSFTILAGMGQYSIFYHISRHGQ
jgi:hypothetical protein